MKNTAYAFVLACVFMLSSSMPVLAGGTSLGLKFSTLGVGIEAEQRFSSQIGGRLGFNYFTFEYDGVEDDIDYDFELDLQSLAALVDWHPFEGSFRITGGGLLNGNELNSNARPTEIYDIGDNTYTPEEVGTLKGKIDFDDFVPYLGIGWNTTFGEEESSWGFIADLGVVFQGTPSAKLSSNGTLAGTGAFDADLAKEEKDLQDDLNEFEMYPVISIGITRSF